MSLCLSSVLKGFSKEKVILDLDTIFKYSY